MLLSGILLPVPTPFDHEGQVYYRKLEHNVERYSRSPATALTVLGPWGECALLDDEERRTVLKTAMAAATPEKVMLAGTGLESATATLRLTEAAAALGYDAALVGVPLGYRRPMQPRHLRAFFRLVADRSPLPLVLCGGVPGLTVELVAELSGHSNIIGLEDASDPDTVRALAAKTAAVRRNVTVTERFEAATGRMLKAAIHPSGPESAGSELVPAESLAKASSAAVQMVGTLRTRQKQVGFQLLAGRAEQMVSSLEAGAAGVLTAFAAAAPGACFEVYAAFRDGDRKLAEEKQQRIAAAASRVVDRWGIPGLKWAMDCNGYYGGHGRSPWLPLEAADRAEIERLMANIRS